MHCRSLMIKTEGEIVDIDAYQIKIHGRHHQSDIIKFTPIYMCEVIIDNQKEQYRVNSHITKDYETEEEAIAALQKEGYPIEKKVSLYVNPKKSKHSVIDGIMPNARLEERMYPHKYLVRKAIITFFLGPFLVVVGLGGGIIFSIYKEKKDKKKIEQRKKRVEEIKRGEKNSETF